MHGLPQDQRHHEARGGMHPMAPPTGSAYRVQHPGHGQDQFHQQYAPQTLHTHHQRPYGGPESHGQQHFSRPPEHQANIPQQTAHKTRSSWVPNLLGPDREPHIDAMMFSLEVRQQPRAARACGFGDRDRRVIDPPPIVQLKVDGPSLSEEERRTYLRYPNYVMNCSIWDESGFRDASYMPDEYNHQRRLMGSLVGTPFVGDDDRGEEGCFFCFSDLSCRTPGAFRLKFTLIMIDPARAAVLRHFPILTEIKTDIFQVFSAKEFPGMVASSSLAKKLKEQGCIISIKKGNDRGRPRGGDGRSDDEDE
ncbi:VosA [Cordyceps militaris CM01]|uniref:VosA n=2 Tax=Cordyceps militaris TaxID=73501 RepID=G3J9D4_CORMM|nr:VosA [Cordyceps militaris CM01]ATY61132.1 Full Spore development regulator vosA [Cordyceps militaris]EGX94113.1 VosA [Cordyceps militaris CM01]